jgi:hypothetical protein
MTIRVANVTFRMAQVTHVIKRMALVTARMAQVTIRMAHVTIRTANGNIQNVHVTVIIAHDKKAEKLHQSVGRVLSFFSSRRNWDSPHPVTRRQVCPPPFGSGGMGGGALPLGGRGWGSPNFNEGTIHFGTLGLYIRYFVSCTQAVPGLFVQHIEHDLTRVLGLNTHKVSYI